MDDWSVCEYRVAGDALIVFDWREAHARARQLGPLDGAERTIYVRPMGAVPWGWFTGPFSMDRAARVSHRVT